MKFSYGDQFIHWVEWTRKHLPEAGTIPSIAASFSEFAAPWLQADQMYLPDLVPEFGDALDDLARHWTVDMVSPLGEPDAERFTRSFDQLTAHPGDLASRFTVLHLYYNLPALHLNEEECRFGSSYEDVDELEVRQELDRATQKRIKKFKSDLALLVRHLDVAQVPPDWRIVRWEILNSYAIGDLDRALCLYNRADDLKLVDPAPLRIMRGQFRYLTVFGEVVEASIDEMLWEPAVYPDGTELGQLLFASGLGMARRPKSELSNAELSSLRYAAVDLDYGLCLQPKAASVYRPMLARCLMLTDQQSGAISQYEEVLKSELLDADPEFGKQARKSIANSFARLGRSDRAIEILSELAEEFPAEKGLYLRIAELQGAEGRFSELAESLRKEAGRSEELGNDWRISALIALGDTRNTSEALVKEIRNNPRVYGPLEFALRQYWPLFESLSEDSRKRWVVATERLATISPEPAYRKAVLADIVGLLVEAVERELHDRLFLCFKARVRAEPTTRDLVRVMPSTDAHAKPFCDFLLKHDDTFELGKMTYVLNPQKGHGPVFEKFREWLRTVFPKLNLKLGDIDKLNAFRKPKAHGASATMDLEGMPRLCIDTMKALVDATRQ